MEKVYTFSKKFLESEAKVATLARFPDLEAYNKALQEYYSFLVKQLQGATGYMPKDKPLSDVEYEMFKGYPDVTPREIFKISEYNNSKYGKAWVVFVSEPNFDETYKSLQDAFIVIEENGELKIAKFLLYTNYNEMGDRSAPYRWDDMQGYLDLNFESLKNPTKIERYVEPSDWDEGMKIYRDDI